MISKYTTKVYHTMTVLLEYINFIAILHKCINIAIMYLTHSCYVGIMLNAFNDPLCSKLYWNNGQVLKHRDAFTSKYQW